MTRVYTKTQVKHNSTASQTRKQQHSLPLKVIQLLSPIFIHRLQNNKLFLHIIQSIMIIIHWRTLQGSDQHVGLVAAWHVKGLVLRFFISLLILYFNNQCLKTMFENHEFPVHRVLLKHATIFLEVLTPRNFCRKALDPLMSMLEMLP